MKLFGKKTLALLLALSMVMSVCVFAGDAVNLTVGDTTNLSVAAEGATGITWSSSAPTIASVSNGTVTGVAAGTATITANYTVGEGESAAPGTEEWTVTVNKATVTAMTGTATGSVPYGAAESVIKAKLPSSVQATVGESSVTIPTSELRAWTVGAYDEVKDVYPCTAALKDDSTKYTGDAVATVEVPAASTWALSNDIPVSGVVYEDGDTIKNLDDAVENAIKSALGVTSVSVSGITFGTGDNAYGDVNSSDNYVVDLSSTQWDKLEEDGSLTDPNVEFSVVYNTVTYTGKIDVTIYSTSVKDTFTYAGGTLSSVASRINSLVEIATGYDMEAIKFDSVELDGGMLWEDNNYEEEVYEDEYYTPTELAGMVYMPDGSGETTYLSYVAYTEYDADDGVVEEDTYYVEGVIRLYSDEFLLLTAEIGNDEVLDINGEDLLDAVYEWDDDFEVKYIKFSSIPNSTSSGYLYYEYDEDDNSNTKVTSSKSYYVDPTGSQAELTSFTYVPTDSTDGVINIVFKAYKSGSNSVTGIIQINVIEVADITINANKGQTVEIDPDLFLEFIEEKDTSNKDLEIVSVAISGAPYQSKKGYLVTDGEELNKSGTKTFYADEEDVDVDKKKYDLFDLYFKGGSSDNTVNGTFKVTYLRSGSTTKRTAEGTIDFITGAVTTNSLSGTTQAAMVVDFSKSLGAFEALGDNDNEYIVFTSLPVGGKLVYNWGQAGQKDVTVGTEYWLSYKAGKQLMTNVTFVPSYSASKIDQVVSMNVKGYNSKGKSVFGQVNIAVDYAMISAQFSDVANSTYADSVDFLYNEGITTGMTATTFGPNSNVTRAQFVTFLWRAAGSPTVTGVTNTFTDVKNAGEFQYAYQAILWAVKNGITTGRSATKFDPAANVTHQELLTFLYRYDVNYLGHSAAASPYVNYTDFNSVDAYAQTPVKWADYKGILTGYAIQPKVAGTRATVALWLHRMLTL